MANPLFNELIIGTGSKDKFSQSFPRDDAQFANCVLDPVLARAPNAAFSVSVPDAPRLDLLPLVTYSPPIVAAGTPPGPVADSLRPNVGVAPPFLSLVESVKGSIRVPSLPVRASRRFPQLCSFPERSRLLGAASPVLARSGFFASHPSAGGR